MKGENIIPDGAAVSNQISLEPLGDQGVLVRAPDEAAALCLAAALRGDPPAWLVDVVQAYTTVAVFHDATLTGHAEVSKHLRALAATAAAPSTGKLFEIPCCYDHGPDLARVAEATGLSVAAVIATHAATTYTVYAIGFCPGFPYLGYLPPALQGVPRLPTPRTRVEAGSVGLTGRQTGIYTEPRPGGWNLIGRTPLVLVDVEAGYFPLRTGDRVRFTPISHAQYDALAGQRLHG